MRIASHVWDFRYTHYMMPGWEDRELIVYEIYKFWSFQITLPIWFYVKAWRKLPNREKWFYWKNKAEYDGVPYYMTRIGIFVFVWGEQGGWGGVDLINELSEFGRRRDYC